jgi:hypothetical protein
MRDYFSELLVSAGEDVKESRMLYADNPEKLRESAILKMEAALELLRVYRLLKEHRGVFQLREDLP